MKRWDISTGECIETYKVQNGDITTCCVSVDGKSILSTFSNFPVIAGENDTSLKIWDIKTAKEIRSFKGFTCCCANITAKPNWLVGACWDNKIKLLDLNSGDALKTFKGHTEPITSVAVSTDGKWVASCARDKSLKVWDVEKNLEAFTIDGLYTGCSISTDGRHITAVATKDKTLRVWNLFTGKQLYMVENGECGCASQDNICLFSAIDHSINIYRIIVPNNAKKEAQLGRSRSKTIKILKKANSDTK